jgi:type II secretion system protein N
VNDRVKKAAAAFGYSAWFVLLFVILTWVTFPWSRVRDQAVVAAHDGGWALQIDSLGSAFVGVRAKGFSLARLDSKGEPGPALVTVDKLKVKTGFGGAAAAGLEARAIASAGGVPTGEFISRMLSAVGTIQLTSKLYGGKLKATLDGQDGGEASRISWKAEGLDLSKYVVETEAFSMEPRGRLRSTADITWHWTEPKKSSGQIDLSLDSLVLSKTKVSFLTLPEMAFSRSEAHLKISRGKAEFRDTVFEADEVEIHVDGFVTLSNSFMRSRLSLQLKFKLRDDLDGLTKMAIGANPNHKDTEGWYHYQINGTLSRPRFRESPAAARGGRRSGAPTRTKRNLGDDDDDDDDRPKRSSRRPGRSNRTNPDKVERSQLSPAELVEREEARAKMAEERVRRREERRARREELMQRRRERQQELDSVRDLEAVPIGTLHDDSFQIDPEDLIDEFIEPEVFEVEGEEEELLEDDLEFEE